MSIISCTSPRPSCAILPVSSVTSAPSASFSRRSSSPSRRTSSPRRGAGTSRHCSKAAAARAIAASVPAASVRATCASVSPVIGVRTSRSPTERRDRGRAGRGCRRLRAWRLVGAPAGPGDRSCHAHLRYAGAPADVAQLARASPCHGEGRGFEPLHPLRTESSGCQVSRRWTAAVDSAFAMRIVEGLAGIGASDLGFRVAGTPEDDAVCAFVAEQMARDRAARTFASSRCRWTPGGSAARAWRWTGEVLPCSSFGGVPGTPPDGLEGELVFVGEGTRGELAGRRSARAHRALRLARRPALLAVADGRRARAAGALAVICTCLPGARYYQGERALGSFDGMWLAGSPPLGVSRARGRHDADRAPTRRPAAGAPDVAAELTPNATAHNVTGDAAGAQRRGADRHRRPSRLLVRRRLRRRDGSRRDARDRESARRRRLRAGAADRLHLPHGRGVRARRLGVRLADRRLVADRARAPGVGAGGALYINIEGTGMACPTGVDAPPELRRFARGVVSRARAATACCGTARRWGVPRTGTEQWPFAADGVPSLGVADQVDEYMRTEYHTQHDRLELVDPDCLAAAIKAPCAARDRGRPQAGGALRPGRTLAAAPPPQRSRGAAALRRRHAAPARGARPPRGGGRRGPPAYAAARAAFHAVATVVEGLNAMDKQDLSYRQAHTDLVALSSASRSLARGRGSDAVAALERVGRNALTVRLSEPCSRTTRSGISPTIPASPGPARTRRPRPTSGASWRACAARPARGRPGPGSRSRRGGPSRALADAQTRIDRVAGGIRDGRGPTRLDALRRRRSAHPPPHEQADAADRDGRDVREDAVEQHGRDDAPPAGRRTRRARPSGRARRLRARRA